MFWNLLDLFNCLDLFRSFGMMWVFSRLPHFGNVLELLQLSAPVRMKDGPVCSKLLESLGCPLGVYVGRRLLCFTPSSWW